MTTGSAGRRLLLALDVALLIGIYLALLADRHPGSVAYWTAIVAGAALFLATVVAASGAAVVHAALQAAARLRPRTHAALAVLPWIAIAGTAVLGGTWWIQRPTSLKLFVLCFLVNWSVAWLSRTRGGENESARAAAEGRAPDGETRDEGTRRFLVATSVVLVALGVDGAAFGIAGFGVGLSAILALAGIAIAIVAALAGPAARSNATAACVGILLGFVCAEAGTRLLHLGETLGEVDSAYYAREFHNITPPRSAFVNWPRSLDEFTPALVETNSLGIRGPEIPGPVDVLLIGDSMIEARQLAWEKTLTARLQAAFTARGASVRVAGHGVRGWAPLLEWNWYLKVGRQLHPRLVLLFFFWNDLWTDGDEVQTFNAVMRADGRPDYFNVAVEPEWVWYKRVRAVRMAGDVLDRVGVQTLRRAFSLFGGAAPGRDLPGAQEAARRMAADAHLSPAEIDRLLTRPLDALDPRLRGVAQLQFWPPMRPLALWTAAQREAAAKTEHELKLFADDVARDGGRLVIVEVPNPYQIAPSECAVSRFLDGLNEDTILPAASGLQAWLQDVSQRLGIEVLDPSDGMRAFHRGGQGDAQPLYLRADCHWSERGHQFMADYLADWYLGRKE